MAGSFIAALVTVHLLAGQAFARQAPAVLGSAPGVHVLYTASTKPGPSPSIGDGNQPSAGQAKDDGALNGAHGVGTVFCPSPCHHPTMAGEKPHNQLNVTGKGKISVY
ncbi:hypothetical protein EJB05_30853, partial [Eragrostis curvula]